MPTAGLPSSRLANHAYDAARCPIVHNAWLSAVVAWNISLSSGIVERHLSMYACTQFRCSTAAAFAGLPVPLTRAAGFVTFFFLVALFRAT